MHTYASVASLVLAIGARMAFSAALPDRPVFEGCGQDYGSPDQTKYTISNKVAAPGPPVTGSFSCVGSDTGKLKILPVETRVPTQNRKNFLTLNLKVAPCRTRKPTA